MSRYDNKGEITIIVDANNMDIAFRCARSLNKDFDCAQPMTEDEWIDYEGFYYTFNEGAHTVHVKNNRVGSMK